MKKLLRFIFVGIFLTAQVSIAAVTTDPNITGMGGGGVTEGSDVGFGNITATSINLGQGTLSDLSLNFGDGDTGFYEIGDDTLSIAVVGVEQVRVDASKISGTSTGNFRISHSASSATVPAYNFVGDDDTGIGRAGANQLSLISGGVEIIRIDGSGFKANGSVTFSSMTTIFGDYSAINNMNQILCDATAEDIDIHIVSASGAKGRTGNVKKIDASGNNCCLEPSGAETIDGTANKCISTRWENLTYFSDDSNLLIR